MLVMSDIPLKTQQGTSTQLMVYQEDSNSRQVVPILLAQKKDMPADDRTKKPQSKHTIQMNHTPNRHKLAVQRSRHLCSEVARI